MKTRYMKVAKGKAIGISRFPNFSATGSIRGMKTKYYGKNALLVRCGMWIFNVPRSIYDQAR